MQKLTAKHEMYKIIKNHYKQQDDRLKVDVIFNQMHGDKKEKWLKKLDPKWKNFLNFIEKDNIATSLIIWSMYKMLETNFGRCDFKFEGNRTYRNWLFECEGLFFILSLKSEVVLPQSKKQSENFGNALLSVQYHLFNMALDFAKNNKDYFGDGFDVIESHIAKLEEKGIINNNQFVL